MNNRIFLMTSVAVGMGLLLAACVSSGSMLEKNLEGAGQGNSVDYHVATIQQHEGKTAILDERIQKLEERITRFSQKPYLDPKGFRRSGWKILKGTLRREVNNLQEQIVWHRKELSRLQNPMKSPRGMKEMEERNS